MPYSIGIAQGYAVRDGSVACDEAVRNGRMGLEAARAVTASPARRGVQGMKAAATMKTASGTKATAAVETATAATVETTAPATVETTAPATVETAAPAAMKTAATAMARLGYVCEREPRHCARQDRSKH
jgi:hypothetical protein